MTFEQLGEIVYKPMGKHVRDITGQRFGNLVVQEYVGLRKGKAYWRCMCDCGNITYTMTSNLTSYASISCGCVQRKKAYEICMKRNVTHGYSKKERLYFIWKGMRERCFNSHNKEYKNYGGRGITICDEWNDYLAFRDWSLSHGYDNKLSIDRINNDGNYCPENCRWATREIQCGNTRRNIFLTYNGETHSPKEWAKKLGIPQHVIYERRFLGWPEEKIISEPIPERFIKGRTA